MVAQVRDRRDESDHMVAAYEAALVVAREITPEAVLQRIVDLAREVVPARYAALGVVDEQKRIVQIFTSGVTPEVRAGIGRLPKAHGLLGKMIHECAPLLIPDIAADPASAGFPPGHPPMRTLAGVPILLGGRVLGTLYLAERWDEQPFDEENLAALQVLATHAAAAIDRARAYQRVEAQRDQLRITLDSLPAGVLIVSGPDGRIDLTNRALSEMLFGPASPPGRLPVYSRDVEVLRANGTPLPHEQGLSCRALKGEVIRNQQLLLKTANGRQMPVLAQAEPLSNASGVVEGAVLVFQDITRMRDAERLKDDFLSLVSHEVRTPLTTIHGGAHLLMNQGDDLDQQTRREILRDIVDESDRLDRMLANMLVLTDVMAGRLEARIEPLLVEQLVRTAATSVAARTGIHTFNLDIAPDLPPAEGDPALLAQVLSNLYQNAVKYSPAGGKITTSVTCDGQTVTIEVVDQGVGIAADELDRVFDRFFRASVDPSVRGTGLGLYLSRHLVNVQGGQIAASSPGPGKGAAFTVTLPIAADWMAVSVEEKTAREGGE